MVYLGSIIMFYERKIAGGVFVLMFWFIVRSVW